MKKDSQHHKVWQASVDQSGRVLLPAELRRLMAVKTGSQLLWVKDDRGLHLTSFDESLAEIQKYYLDLAPVDVVWSDELIEQRRVEASHE